MNDEYVKQIILNNIPDAEVHVLDPMNDGQHLEAIVISPSFEGKMLIAQHKMVMGPLREALKVQVHALGLKTFTPARWNEERGQYNL